jgi:O-antigen ligase
MALRTALRLGRPVVSPALLTTIVVIPLAIAAALGAIVLAGTKTGVALATVAVMGPLAAYAALIQPLIFPFCLFVILVPFDNLLSFAAFGTLTRLVGIACGGSLILWLLRTRRYVVPDCAILGWAAFMVWALCSFAWAIDMTAGAEYLFTVLQLFALYAALSFFPVNSKTLATIVAAVVVSGTIASGYGVYLFRNGIDVSTNGRLYLSASAGMVDTGAHIDPNHFAAALLLPFVLALVAVVESKRIAMKLTATVCLLLIAAGVAVAGSRGAILAIGVMVLYLLIRSRKRLVYALVATAGLGVALSSYSNVLERFGNAAAGGGAGRLDIWKVGLAAFHAHPIIGSGYGNFLLAYDRAYLSVFVQTNKYWNQAPHSIIISTAVELGIFGLLLFLSAWWLQFRSLRTIAPDDPYYSLRLALEAALLGVFTASLFLDTFIFKYLWLTFMLMMLARNASMLNNAALARSSPT